MFILLLWLQYMGIEAVIFPQMDSGAQGRKITESDGVLMTYRRVVEKQFLKVAKERSEHLPEASLREISLHYVDAWVAANERRLGIAMPFSINGGGAGHL